MSDFFLHLVWHKLCQTQHLTYYFGIHYSSIDCLGCLAQGKMVDFVDNIHFIQYGKRNVWFIQHFLVGWYKSSGDILYFFLSKQILFNRDEDLLPRQSFMPYTVWIFTHSSSLHSSETLVRELRLFVFISWLNFLFTLFVHYFFFHLQNYTKPSIISNVASDQCLFRPRGCSHPHH